MRRALPAALLFLVVACDPGRSFKRPRTLAEWRPTRAVASSSSAEPENEAFRATPPDRVAVRARPMAMPTEARRSNGVRVVMLERHDFPSTSAVLVLDRGAAAGPPGVAALYSEAMTGSSTEYKSAEAWEYLGFVGGSVGNVTWHDAIALQINALSPLFVSALTRAAPMFTSPALDSDDIDEARVQLAAQSANDDSDPSDIAHDALYAALFPPPHPYGTPVSGEHGRAAPITDAAVRAFRAANLSAAHVSVAVVGDFKPASMQRVLEKALAKLPQAAASAAAAVPSFAVPPKGGGKLIVIDRPGAAQSNVAIGWPGPRASEPELVALDVLAGATAGDLSTRLNITVRKELGASYGVQMSATGMRDGGLVRITAAIDTARTTDALRGLFKELERLRSEPLTQGELVAAKLRTYHDLERGSTRGLAMYLGHAMAEGLPPAHVVTHNARVDAVTVEDVRASSSAR